MTEASLNNFDLILVAIMALSCLFAFFRGLVREVLSLVAWVGAAIVTLHYFPAAVDMIQPHFKNRTIGASVAILGIYIAALVCFSIVNIILLKTIKGGSAGMLDNLLGLIFGAFRGTMIIAFGFLVFGAMHVPESAEPEWLKTSLTRPYAEQGASVLKRLIPEEYMKRLTSPEETEKVSDDNQSKDAQPVTLQQWRNRLMQEPPPAADTEAGGEE